ncbi:hypothetical protein MCUN1_002238 [Malassezia cuniculi]|uniref:Uncharacterized protein n=1 Tax=Malassezia cuniculi TaxID=948313 RepID=A0AAF0J770_9BASI|nr:hypothetical protein MCUN1_002238 [Malassezia cuniculi]
MAALLQSRAGPWQPAIQLDGQINIVRCCNSPLARSLVLLSTDIAVHVYETVVNDTSLSFAPVTSFLVGSRTTAAAWSPGSSYDTGEDAGDECKITIIVATDTQELRLLQSFGKKDQPENRLLGRTGIDVNDIAWCMVPGYEQYVAVAGNDGTLQLWDLETESGEPSHTDIYLETSLLSVSFHVKMPKLLYVIDAAGVSRLVDWLASMESPSGDAQSTLALADPETLAEYTTQGIRATGSGTWQPQDPDLIGALLGTRWSVWNAGGTESNPSRPVASGELSGTANALGRIPSGGGFRWCSTNPRLFAVFVPALSAALLAQTGCVTESTGSVKNAFSLQVCDLAFLHNPWGVDVNSVSPFTGRAIDMETTGSGAAGVHATLPTAYGISDADWTPQRVGAYDVLLVAVGSQIIPVPATAT